MSDMRAILVDTATRLFDDLCTRELFSQSEDGAMVPAAWQRIATAGLERATLSEARGGDGTDLGDALALVREAGRAALPLPLAETLLAELALAKAGLPPMSGIGTVGPVAMPSGGAPGGQLSLERSGSVWVLSGTLYRVPWARHAAYLAGTANHRGNWRGVVVCGPELTQAVTRRDSNWAGEPRDTLVFDRLALSADAVGAAGLAFSPTELLFQGALFRLVAMAGAMGQVLRFSVQYAQERSQFGKPIGGFQAIQHQLAVLASQVAAANAAADAAVDAASRGPALFEIAAAKARIGEAAHIANGIAHQVHGAMGFTQEHALHRSTRRLWAWRDEFGNETEWAGWVGRVAARLGGDGLWPFVAARDKAIPVG